jgi:hypothetical protein
MVWWGREGIVTNTRGGADSTTIYNRYAPLITLKLNNARGGGEGDGAALPFSLSRVYYNLIILTIAAPRPWYQRERQNKRSVAGGCGKPPLCAVCSVFWLVLVS